MNTANTIEIKAKDGLYEIKRKFEIIETLRMLISPNYTYQVVGTERNLLTASFTQLE